MPASSACPDTPINGLYGWLWLLRNVPLHRRVSESVHQCTIHTWNGGELWVTLVVQKLHCWMESWYITIQGIHTPIPQRVQFSCFPAPQCIGESSSHWAVPCKVHSDRNSSGECWRRGIGACPLHRCHCRWWEHPIRRRGNVHELEQHSTRRSSRSLIVQVLTWTTMNAKLENQQLKRILQSLTINLAWSTRNVPLATPTAIPPMAALGVTASSSGAQASNSKSTARLPNRASPRVQSRVEGDQPESAWKHRRVSTGAGSSGSRMTHVNNRGEGKVEDVLDYEKFTAI